MDPFKLFRPMLVNGARLNFNLSVERDRIWLDFGGQRIEKFGLTAETARKLANSLLEKADKIEAERGLITVM